MNKIFKIFLVVSLLCMNFISFIDGIHAEGQNYTGNEVIARIEDSEDVARDLINKLTNWSNLYASTIRDITSEDFINRLDSSTGIQTIIDELNSNGYSAAANSLESIKVDLQNDIDYLKTTTDMIATYIEEGNYTDNIDETDVLYNSRTVFRNLKQSIKTLAQIYYDLYYDEISNKIDTFNSYQELLDMYDEMSDMLSDNNATYRAFKQKLDRAKNIYISRDLEIYEPMIKEEFREYYQTFKTDYQRLYDKLETKLQTKLDEKIDSIITGVDRTNASEVIAANEALYDIIDKIEDVQGKVDSKFNQFNDLFTGIDIVDEYAREYEDTIKDRLQEANDYTRSKLIDLGLLIKIKNEIDRNKITLDLDRGIIIYDSKNLTPSVLINKLETNIGELRATNTYNGKVGTMSKIEDYYNNAVIKELIVIVKGDINPDGKIDISDLVKMCDKIYGLIDLDFYQMTAADFDSNDRIDITDLVNLCDRIYE